MGGRGGALIAWTLVAEAKHNESLRKTQSIYCSSYLYNSFLVFTVLGKFDLSSLQLEISDHEIITRLSRVGIFTKVCFYLVQLQYPDDIAKSLCFSFPGNSLPCNPPGRFRRNTKALSFTLMGGG
jgi:hypothetical protein